MWILKQNNCVEEQREQARLIGDDRGWKQVNSGADAHSMDWLWSSIRTLYKDVEQSVDFIEALPQG